MSVIYTCFVICFGIEAALCRVVDDKEDRLLDQDHNSTIVHNLQRRDMQSSTVGCRLDSTNKMMYYFVKFGRYATWSLEDRVEMVVRTKYQ
uniref:Secreted protein n=1 Tax=Romanomermis culicivorax TaxID=13658 RepID=A0A915KCD1_ROMCU